MTTIIKATILDGLLELTKESGAKITAALLHFQTLPKGEGIELNLGTYNIYKVQISVFAPEYTDLKGLEADLRAIISHKDLAVVADTQRVILQVGNDTEDTMTMEQFNAVSVNSLKDVLDWAKVQDII
jgi:hypothetical protein